MTDDEDSLEFHHAGLTLEQARQYNLPENFERPGEWQWEALSDSQAKEVIQGTLSHYLNLDALGEAIEGAKNHRTEWTWRARRLLLRAGD